MQCDSTQHVDQVQAVGQLVGRRVGRTFAGPASRCEPNTFLWLMRGMTGAWSSVWETKRPKVRENPNSVHQRCSSLYMKTMCGDWQVCSPKYGRTTYQQLSQAAVVVVQLEHPLSRCNSRSWSHSFNQVAELSAGRAVSCLTTRLSLFVLGIDSANTS